MSRNTVIAGTREIATGVGPSDRVRAKGAGPKALIDTRPGLLEALDELVHPETRGTPMSLLRWTSKSTAKLAGELVEDVLVPASDSERVEPEPKRRPIFGSLNRTKCNSGCTLAASAIGQRLVDQSARSA